MRTNKSKKEPASLQTLKSLHGKKRLQYLWDYFKFPLILTGILLYGVIYMICRYMTDKEPLLYVALVNINAGETLTRQLGEDFTAASDMESSDNGGLHLYSGLYLTDDADSAYFEYTYASRMKILAAIDGEQLDVVLMDREAFDAFSQNGYLCNIDQLLAKEAPALYQRLKPYIVENISILEDNAFEVQFDPSLSYNAVTKQYPMGLDLSQAGPIAQAGFEDTVYLGIIANSPRTDAAVEYLGYLFRG